ncbi:putative phage capsid family [Actinomyces urogenitalis DSM 15434]|jgi:HK97 family phage major capsid protein|uniref:Putative phage capsid family n=2 Tax=Actinomyces urogenitalis TaxID=103621 RepID=C0W521_9ACTO|nr:phage major capsid protein [Actinomyces urogenitalis]EEH66178.1 putative phage capsid family [Actinomyces urogenitalis DSM 15434]WOO94327.1 phage major capsid protein [Actinomyces urogenitalis]
MAETMTTNGQPFAWMPQSIEELVVQPVTRESVALIAAGSTRLRQDCDGFRVPVVTKDPVAAWVKEGEEIPLSGSKVAEVADRFHKVAGLSVLSRELVLDSSPDIAKQVGEGLARDIARNIDTAFFGKRKDGDTTAPIGIAEVPGTGTVSAGGKWTNTDVFITAAFQAQLEGASLSAFAANPADAMALAQIKEQAGSQRLLLNPTPTAAAPLTLAGVPLYVSPAIEEGTIWGLPQNRIKIGVREDVELTRDESAFFTSDRIAIRATMRVAFLYPHPAAIQKITKA